MKTLQFIGILFCITLCFSCDDNNDSTQEQDLEHLNEMFEEISVIASSEVCEDASLWSFTSYGSKACGGPVGYMAYPTTIDTADFLQKIEAHREAEDTYNIKWGIISDCSLPAPPSGVACENGNAILVYQQG